MSLKFRYFFENKVSRLDILFHQHFSKQFLDYVCCTVGLGKLPPIQCLYSHSVANYLHAPRMVNVEQVWVLHSHPPRVAMRGLDGDPEFCINKRWKLTAALRDGNH